MNHKRLIFILSTFVLSIIGLAFSVNISQQREPHQNIKVGINFISGKVIGNRGPVPDARVRIQGDTLFVLTDEEGRFSLPVDRYPGYDVSVTAGKEGWINNGAYYPGGSRNVVIRLERIPSRDSRKYTFISPVPEEGRRGGMMGGMMRGMMDGMMGMMSGNCGSCHTKFYEQWKTSTMARTTKNPVVLSFYKGTDYLGREKVQPGYLLDNPIETGSCGDCHAPTTAIRRPGKVDLRKAASIRGVTSSGIHCDFCHKIKDVEVSNKPGVQTIKMLRYNPRGGMMMRRVFAFGPYDDVVVPPMVTSYSELFEKSEFCSSCHQHGEKLKKGGKWNFREVYKDPSPDELYENGKVIPNQWTYQEWLEWQSSLPEDDPDKGRQCQNCHMNWTKELLPYDNYIVDGMVRTRLGVYRDPSMIHPHLFEGATEPRLKGAAYLNLDAEIETGELTVYVEVTNVNAGHRLPTGFSMRHMILLITAKDEGGRELKQLDGPKVPEWGGVGPIEEGNYAGRPGKGFAKILADDKGNINVPYWKAIKVVSDNRIKPKEYDESVYKFQVPDGVKELTVEAGLVYRKFFKNIADEKRLPLGEVIMQEKREIFYVD